MTSGATTPDNSALPGNPTVLIVDDEELMREVASIMVEDYGGKVRTAVDGVDAVEVFAEHRGQISCVCLDFSMPQMNGYEAFLEIRKLDPKVGVVMVSGLAITPEVEELRKKGEITFLSKPFHEAQLITAIRAALTKNT